MINMINSDDFLNDALFVVSFYVMISLIYKCMHDL